MAQKKAKKKGRPPKKLDPEKVIQRAVQLATGEVNVNYEGKEHLVKGSEMTRDMNTFLRERTGMMAKEFYERVTAKLENLVDTLANDLAEKHDKIPPQSLAVALGIMLDKVNLLKGRPQALTANVNVGVGPKDRSREEILQILGGEKKVSEVDEGEKESE